MELRRYWQTIMRWWWVIAIVFVLAAVAGFLQTRGAARYEAQATLLVRQIDELPVVTGTSGSIIAASNVDIKAASEYLVDDYLEIVRGREFTDRMYQYLKQNPAKYGPVSVADVITVTPVVPRDKAEAQRMITTTNVITPGMVYQKTGATRIHRLLVLSAYADSPYKAVAMVRAGADVLVNDPSGFIASTDKVAFSLSDYPRIVEENGEMKPEGTVTSDSSKKLTNAITTALLGLIAGLALAFLLDYLDDRVRDGRDARRQLGLDVISVPLKGKLP